MKQRANGKPVMGLRAIREDRGLSQATLAQAVGRTQAFIAFLEQGRTKQPTYDDVMALAAALQCAPDELFPRKRNRKAPREAIAS